jgi:hypothetical protein
VLYQDFYDLIVVFNQEVANNIEVLFDLRCVLTDNFKQGVFGVCLADLLALDFVFEIFEDYRELKDKNLQSIACFTMKSVLAFLLTNFDGLPASLYWLSRSPVLSVILLI